MAAVERCVEAIANFVLDAGEPISCRALAAQVGGSAAQRHAALASFAKDNADGVGCLRVTIERGVDATRRQTTKAGDRSPDPRSRVIRISAKPSADGAVSQVYGVFPVANAQDGSTDEAVVAPMATAFWAQERKILNDLFDKVERTQPLTRELKAFYESDVICAAATSRADVGDNQGEEAVSIFDSMHTTTGARTKSTSATTSSAAASTKSTFFKNTPANSNNSKPKAHHSSSVTTSTFRSKSATQTPAQGETKRVDVNTMNNVLTVDSDDDEDESDDGGAPVFVKKTSAATKSRKTRLISDDEEDEEAEAPSSSVASPKSNATKRRLPAVNKADAPTVSKSSNKRLRVEEEEVQEVVEEAEPDEHSEPQAEEDISPTNGPSIRRVQVTRTRINEQGYMVTEKVWEEVEVSPEQLEKERAEAAKKKKEAAAKAAAAAQKARAASNKAAKPAGPPRQKKLDFFFTRK